MPRARPRRRSTLLVGLVASLASGCVTRALWDEWPEGPPATPVRLERAVRTGSGAYHVEAAFSDGSRRHLSVRPFEVPGADDEAWPDAIRRTEIVAEVEGPLPPGAPLRIDGLPLADEVGCDDPETISLEGGALRVVNPVTGGWTLATFAPARAPTLTEQVREYHLRLVVVTLTPLAAALDGVAAVLMFGPLAPATLLAGAW